MAKVSLVGEENDTRIDVELIKNNRPTPLLLALAAAEITFDILIAYTAYRIMRKKA